MNTPHTLEDIRTAIRLLEKTLDDFKKVIDAVQADPVSASPQTLDVLPKGDKRTIYQLLKRYMQDVNSRSIEENDSLETLESDLSDPLCDLDYNGNDEPRRSGHFPEAIKTYTCMGVIPVKIFLEEMPRRVVHLNLGGDTVQTLDEIFHHFGYVWNK